MKRCSFRQCPSSIFKGFRRLSALKDPKAVSVISVPVNLGQPMLGPDLTPSALFQSGLVDLLSACNWRINIVSSNLVQNNPSKLISSEKQSTPLEINAKNIEEVGRVCYNLSKIVSEELLKQHFILILGGDHCIPIGSIPPIMQLRPKTGIVWVDAHADINTPQSSLSGNIHGMPLGFLLGLAEKINTYPSFDWFKSCLHPEDIVYVGLRDLDAYEKLTIKKLGIKAFTMHEVDKLGIGKVMEECLSYFDGRNLHLSFDIDAVDPFFAPHTGTAVRGGLTFREANYICEALAETGRLTSMELVEVNPAIHTHQEASLTLEMALTLIGSAMGQRIL